MSVEVRYRAFISYSSADRRSADWLHARLEGYKVPPALVGTAGRGGPVPKSLFPVFQDRVELPASADLPSRVSDALRRSDYLIVVCSPNSATSAWVGEEIRQFRALGRADRILALIVGGEPHARRRHGGDSAAECFHPELQPSDTGSQEEPFRSEPLAADARDSGDGEEAALLKLIAGLLGVDLNDLRRRDAEAARRRLLVTRVVAAAVTVLAVFAVLASIVAVRQRDEAATQRDSANRASDKLYWESVVANLATADYRRIGAIVSERAGGPQYEDMFALVQAARSAPEFDYASLGAGMYRLGSAFAADDSRFAVLGGDDGNLLFVWDTRSWKQLAAVDLDGRVLLYGAGTIRGTADPNKFVYGGYQSGPGRPLEFGASAEIDVISGSVVRLADEVIVPVEQDESAEQQFKPYRVSASEAGVDVSGALFATPLPKGTECNLSPARRFVLCSDSYRIKVFRRAQVLPTEAPSDGFPRFVVPDSADMPFDVGPWRIDGRCWMARRYLAYFSVQSRTPSSTVFASSLGMAPPLPASFSADLRWVVAYLWPSMGEVYSTLDWKRVAGGIRSADSIDERICAFSVDQRWLNCPGAIAPAYVLTAEEFQGHAALAYRAAECLRRLGQADCWSCADAIETLVSLVRDPVVFGDSVGRDMLGVRIDASDFWVDDEQ